MSDPSATGEGALDNSDAVERRVEIDDNGLALAVFGQSGSHLAVIERRLRVETHARGGQLTMRGAESAVDLAVNLVEQLITLARKGVPLGADEVSRAVTVILQEPTTNLKDIFCDTLLVSARARPIGPKGLAQKRYVDGMRRNDITFAIGPAGTGKTYLAVAMAVHAYQEQRVRRIVLTRPAVEAGERLGFLPGSMEDKVNELVERGYIEIAPLAFMRGRTLNDSFVILDEAQNTTSEQMKMFLTRLGYDSQAVITGDITQVDLPNGSRSGLVEARELLTGIRGISMCQFTEVDVVRHPLVQKIILAYEGRGRQGAG